MEDNSGPMNEANLLNQGLGLAILHLILAKRPSSNGLTILNGTKIL